jgi:hypothetical protein
MPPDASYSFSKLIVHDLVNLRVAFATDPEGHLAELVQMLA